MPGAGFPADCHTLIAIGQERCFFITHVAHEASKSDYHLAILVVIIIRIIPFLNSCEALEVFTTYSVEQVPSRATSVDVERGIRVFALLNLEICKASLLVFTWIMQHVEVSTVDVVNPRDCRLSCAQDCPMCFWV